MLIAVVIVALIILVAVIDISALTVASKADKQIELERPDFIQLEEE